MCGEPLTAAGICPRWARIPAAGGVSASAPHAAVLSGCEHVGPALPEGLGVGAVLLATVAGLQAVTPSTYRALGRWAVLVVLTRWSPGPESLCGAAAWRPGWAWGTRSRPGPSSRALRGPVPVLLPAGGRLVHHWLDVPAPPRSARGRPDAIQASVQSPPDGEKVGHSGVHVWPPRAAQWPHPGERGPRGLAAMCRRGAGALLSFPVPGTGGGRCWLSGGGVPSYRPVSTPSAERGRRWGSVHLGCVSHVRVL